MNSVDAISLQSGLFQNSSDSNIDPALAESSSTPTATSTPTPASETRNTTPNPALLAIQRKRKRGREEGSPTVRKSQAEETANGSDTIKGMRMLAKARLEAAEIVASATKNDIPEALAVLLRNFTKEPRKLNSNDMQIAIDFLSTPDKATIFLTLSKTTWDGGT